MTRKSIGLFTLAIACATALSISASSCDNSNNPATPGDKNNGGKGPQVLDGPCLGTVAVTDCPTGNASLQYDENGNLRVAGMSERSGVNCTFASPINVWHAVVDASFPASGNGSLLYSAQDDQGNVEASLAIRQQSSTSFSILPTYTSAPGGGTPSYDAVILSNGNVVGTRTGLDATTPVVFNSDATCVVDLFKAAQASWDVYQVNSQCTWKLKLQPCCRLVFRLPDGSTYTGDEIKLIERNSNGVYVYLKTKNIFTTGNVASYAVKAASAISTQ